MLLPKECTAKPGLGGKKRLQIPAEVKMKRGDQARGKYRERRLKSAVPPPIRFARTRPHSLSPSSGMKLSKMKHLKIFLASSSSAWLFTVQQTFSTGKSLRISL